MKNFSENFIQTHSTNLIPFTTSCFSASAVEEVKLLLVALTHLWLLFNSSILSGILLLDAGIVLFIEFHSTCEQNFDEKHSFAKPLSHLLMP